ncbi:substrate-binding protein [Bradyrhizobium barranii subsp. apii]|uniref:Substrate-binding protein n=1 Tax=Bradyrhizobium barranii subsp. apii TaxID=2819348 RepID=A0A8T5UY73_9BRAD|nr:substrate-binding protein [Bradyrhizobium barranii]UPT86968.1 substrate-binding protein [Bradyrhizobium barranii subsp. apii]
MPRKDASNISRRSFLTVATATVSALGTGVGTWSVRPADAAQGEAVRVGVATDLTGVLGFAGTADANVARLLVKQINDAGGLLGRPVELYVEDTASDEATAVVAARKLVMQHKVHVVLGGILSSTRVSMRDVIAGRGKGLYIYPQLYEGGECTPYVYCTGPTPAQQCDTLIPWLIANGGKRFALPGANFLWPRKINEYARVKIQEHGGEVVFEEYHTPDQTEFGATVSRILSEKVNVVFNTISPPGVGAFFKQLHQAGFNANGGRLSCAYYDENMLGMNRPEEIEGLANCLDYFRAVADEDSVSGEIQKAYDNAFPGGALLSAGSAATGTYRGLMLWAKAVQKVGKTDREAVAEAIDNASIDKAPGGPAGMVPGSRHCEMRMYIASAENGSYKIRQRSDGLVAPRQCT